MYCSNCGTKIENEDGICPKCGNKDEVVTNVIPAPSVDATLDEKVQNKQIKKDKKSPFPIKRIIIPIFVLCAIIGVAFAYKVISDNSQFHALMLKADNCVDVDNYEDAATYYRNAHKLNPKNEEALTALKKVQSILLQDCIENVKDYTSRGDYDTAIDELLDLQIKKGDPCYKEYQNILSTVKMRPEIKSIDKTGFPLIKVTLVYKGKTKLSQKLISITEDNDKCDITNCDMSAGQAVLSFTAKDVDYASENRKVAVHISTGGIEMVSDGDYDTPAMVKAAMTLVTTDLSDYPNVKAYFRVEDPDNGNRVENLNTTSFSIRESVDGGKFLARKIHSVKVMDGNAGVNIDLLADKSDSIGNEDMDKIKQVMTEFVQNLQYKSGDKAEVLAFDSIVQQMCSYTNDSQLLVNGINNMTAEGMTALYDAMYAGINHAALQGGARCVIAFTDGKKTAGNYEAQDVIDYANKNQVPVYIIGVGDVDEYSLRDIADKTNGRYWYIDDLYDLKDIYNEIYQEQMEMYVVEYESDASLDEYLTRNLTVNVMGNGYKGECSSDFTPTKTIKDDGVNVHNSRYKIFVDDVSWEEAEQKCQDKGGHLVTITSQDEMNQMIKLAKTKKTIYVWIGGYTSFDSEGNIFGHWVTGEDFSYTAWSKGEPSRNDKDNVAERYLMLWNIKKLGGWSWNDQRNDPVADYPSMSGKIAYICEFE